MLPPAVGTDDDVASIKDDPAAIAEVVGRVRRRLDAAMKTTVPGFYPLLTEGKLRAFRASRQPNPYLIDTNYKASLVLFGCWQGCCLCWLPAAGVGCLLLFWLPA